ncbi:MAG: DUF4434 family protein [Pseudomonas sp.]|uniref:DUF4434 domain-containing protein n=1 Tax=Ectopseudomonas mendocina TaxID=300 RepID=A0A379IU11_ECTME|nr:DUF4434 family protein [Pseudomonas mendocina]MBL0951378.1 DUF4434 family protein [Pseudomonas sp.]MDF2072993.1 DUF4434 family protein [Pseudomonas mendocina]SUD39541.1 Uncharacterised protein [Pseudomonas mendocina]
MRRLLIGILLSVAMLQAQAEERLFFQPLNVDSSLDQKTWKNIWRDTAKAGVKVVVVQWTAHGESNFGGRDGWLANSLRAAQEQGLQLVLGLYMDPAYYQRHAELDGPGLQAYWQHQLGLSLAQQRLLRDQWQLPVAGWYLPMELDDVQFQAADRRRVLFRQLQDFAAKLDAPLHVSAYTGAQLAPDIYAAWLYELQSLGLMVWWQDGEGTGNLSKAVRRAYGQALPCEVGIVREAFRQVSADGEPFRAEPAEPKRIYPGCHDEAVFSLSYRPWGTPLRANR